MSNYEKNAQFRELLTNPGLISVPVIYDAMSARLVEQAGFSITCMGGNGSMASLLGYPDLEIATQTEMIGRAKQIAARISIPMYADADTGYGSWNNLKRTVIDYEEAGVSGIHLEDQTSPKKCGAMAGVTVIPAEEMVEKIKLALSVRKDPNFIIIGRTDCYNTMGIEEVIRRCKMYRDAGADVLMPENIYNFDELQQIPKAIPDMPIICDLIDDNGMRMKDQDVYEMGFKIVCRGVATILGVAQYLKNLFADYKANGSMANYADSFMSLHEYEEVLGIDDELELRRRYEK